LTKTSFFAIFNIIKRYLKLKKEVKMEKKIYYPHLVYTLFTLIFYALYYGLLWWGFKWGSVSQVDFTIIVGILTGLTIIAISRKWKATFPALVSLLTLASLFLFLKDFQYTHILILVFGLFLASIVVYKGRAADFCEAFLFSLMQAGLIIGLIVLGSVLVWIGVIIGLTTLALVGIE